MLKALFKLFAAPVGAQRAASRGVIISRQCDGERLDTSLWREVALMSLDASHRPAA
ncbi:hypothetical protein PXK00_03550 [Phaeobacter sp. QD34_3]|uniref:hypothetical protein n=1 Tax=unclassified Phaeobacter TaxID=2621772 RepID=UPI00237F590A|nr:MULTISPECIES: hypothetical protein [unclassified Phaeobacter]MDE4132171.1 hypothetical protein [Phaeobacter sp. QD34_3]MDE4135809.1 hypothetical protein [Phaeobacter sp. QD34_24]